MVVVAKERWLHLVLLVIGTLASAGFATAKEDPRDAFVRQAPAIIRRVLDDEKYGRGVAIALVDRDGVHWSAGFGHVDESKSRKVDADTLFSIQSMTKTFTAAAVLSAVDEGKLDLDAPISKVLPDFEVGTRFSGIPRDQITLRHLLSHRAGFTHEAPIGNNYSREAPSFEQHVASIGETWIRYPVGDRYAYSNLGIDLAGWILSRVDGKSYPAALRARVLKPAGMPRSRLSSEGFEPESNRAVGRLPALGEVSAVIPMAAAGGLYSSANELGRFVASFLNEGALDSRRVISQQGWREMHAIPGPVASFQEEGYGLGVVVRLAADGRVLTGSHDGGGYGFVSMMEWRPEAGLGIVVLRNKASAGRLFGELEKLFDEVASAMPQRRAPGTRKSLVGSPDCAPENVSAQRRLLGTYIRRAGVASVERHNGVFGIKEGKFQPLCLIAPNLAMVSGKGERSTIRFEFDDAGRPLRMIRLNRGQFYDFNDGPGDPRGNDAREQVERLGRYAYEFWGKDRAVFEFREIRGHLYFNDLRLVRGPKAGLYFAANGELLDLTVDPPRFGNIIIRKVAGVETLRARLDPKRGRPVSRSWWRNQQIEAELKAP